MTRIIILAAGKGARMNSVLPKVLVPLKNRPMISYLLDSIKAAEIDARPLIVVSPSNQGIVSEALKNYKLEYVVQEQQLGTGHAVACASKLLNENTNNVLVLYGDHPFFRSASLKKIADLNPLSLTMMTTKLPDFSTWHKNFYHWGRIIRGLDKKIEKIIEFKDANAKELLVNEVNPAVMCFNKDWLLKNLSKLGNENKQQEYYLTDLVKIAFKGGFVIDSLTVDPSEAIGINSVEELQVAESLL